MHHKKNTKWYNKDTTKGNTQKKGIKKMILDREENIIYMTKTENINIKRNKKQYLDMFNSLKGVDPTARIVVMNDKAYLNRFAPQLMMAYMAAM